MSEDQGAKLVEANPNPEGEREERPDEILVKRFLQALEDNIGEFDFRDVICEPESTVHVDGVPVKLDLLQIGLTIADKDRTDFDGMFNNWFLPAAIAMKNMIEDEGYNVARVIGIRDTELTPREGALQLYKNGEKVSVYMKHKYTPGPKAQTEVTLQILVGKV